MVRKEGVSDVSKIFREYRKTGIQVIWHSWCLLVQTKREVTTGRIIDCVSSVYYSYNKPLNDFSKRIHRNQWTYHFTPDIVTVYRTEKFTITVIVLICFSFTIEDTWYIQLRVPLVLRPGPGVKSCFPSFIIQKVEGPFNSQLTSPVHLLGIVPFPF